MPRLLPAEQVPGPADLQVLQRDVHPRAHLGVLGHGGQPLTGPDAPLRDRVRATTAVLAVGATCHVYLRQVDDPDKLRAVVREMATDRIH